MISTIFGMANLNDGWSAEEFIIHQAFEMRMSLFIWTSNTTLIDGQLNSQSLFASEMTSFNVLLAIIGPTMECFGALLDSIATDIMFCTAVTMYVFTSELKFQMEQSGSNHEVLLQYRRLQNVSRRIEEMFSRLFKICHASNLFSCAYFVMVLVLYSTYEYDAHLIFVMIHILKVCLTYYFCLKAADVVSKLKIQFSTKTNYNANFTVFILNKYIYLFVFVT